MNWVMSSDQRAVYRSQAFSRVVAPPPPSFNETGVTLCMNGQWEGEEASQWEVF